MSEDLAQKSVQDTPEAGDDANQNASSKADQFYGKDQEGDEPKPQPKETDDSADDGESKQDNKQKQEDTKDDNEKDVPEKYELKLPKESKLSAEQVEKIEAFAKARGFSNKEAQEYLNHQDELLSNFVDTQKTQLDEYNEQWKSAVKSDKELGGEKYDSSVKLANQAMTKFASKELIEHMVETRLASHPEVVRMFKRIGEAMAPDSLKLEGDTPPADKSRAEKFYGKS